MEDGSLVGREGFRQAYLGLETYGKKCVFSIAIFARLWGEGIHCLCGICLNLAKGFLAVGKIFVTLVEKNMPVGDFLFFFRFLAFWRTI